MVLPAAVPAVLVPAEQVAGDPTPTDVAVPAAVVLAVQLAVVTLRVPAAPEAAPRVTALPVLAIPGTPAVVMIAAATSSVMRGSPETTALGRDVTTAPGREARIARSRVAMTGPVRVVMTGPARVAMTGPVRVVMTGPARAAMTGPVRVVMTGPARAATIGQLRVVMTDQLHVGTTVTHRVGGAMVGRIRAGRTAQRQKTGSHRCGTTKATAVPRVARARRPVAPATTAALPIVAPAVRTEA